MKTNWLVPVVGAAVLLGAGIASARDKLSPAELDPLVKSGRVLPIDALQDAVLDKHNGGHIKKGEVQRAKDGYIYEVELTDRNGHDWDVDVDATTGLLLKDEKD
jgi:uncharacterized membrane protein YkoI